MADRTDEIQGALLLIRTIFAIIGGAAGERGVGIFMKASKADG
jgi:hypothetical protein